MTPILLKPKREVNMRYSKQHKRKQLQEIGISQGDIQQMLFELRDTLGMVTEIKKEYKSDAATAWSFCDKNNPLTLHYFDEFSSLLAGYKQHKTKEARLVNLIKKLKGLQ